MGLIFLWAFFFFSSGCEQGAIRQSSASPSAAPLQVAVGSFPLADFVQKVGGQRVVVENLLKAGKDPHHNEPTFRDRSRLYRSRLFLWEKQGADGWMVRLAALAQEQGVRTEDVSACMVAPPAGKAVLAAVHCWLDPVSAQEMVWRVARVLSTADPSHRSFYQANAQQVNQRLVTLHATYGIELAKLAYRKLWVTHDAFYPLASRFGLSYESLSKGSHGHSELGPRHLQQVIENIRSDRPPVLFVQAGQAGVQSAAAVQRATGVRLSSLHSLEQISAAESEQQVDYFFLMELNLRQLMQGLGGESNVR